LFRISFHTYTLPLACLFSGLPFFGGPLFCDPLILLSPPFLFRLTTPGFLRSAPPFWVRPQLPFRLLSFYGRSPSFFFRDPFPFLPPFSQPFSRTFPSLLESFQTLETFRRGVISVFTLFLHALVDLLISCDSSPFSLVDIFPCSVL